MVVLKADKEIRASSTLNILFQFNIKIRGVKIIIKMTAIFVIETYVELTNS